MIVQQVLQDAGRRWRSCPLTWCTSRGSRKVGICAQLITAESLAG